jgi:hypothetical protein
MAGRTVIVTVRMVVSVRVLVLVFVRVRPRVRVLVFEGAVAMAVASQRLVTRGARHGVRLVPAVTVVRLGRRHPLGTSGRTSERLSAAQKVKGALPHAHRALGTGHATFAVYDQIRTRAPRTSSEPEWSDLQGF